jgi:N-carbamoyl-L-amino-acid hydrolase
VADVVRRVAAEEGLEAEVEPTFALEPLELDAALIDAVESAAAGEGATSRRLPSGAGHDAMVIGRHVPAAMIFVPSAGGISHSPAERSSPDEVELGMRVLAATLEQVAR